MDVNNINLSNNILSINADNNNPESNNIKNDIMLPSDHESIFSDDNLDEYQSIFLIESKYHDLKFSNKNKANAPKRNKICIDPPAIYSFKGLVETPTQIKKQNIKLETFLKARIALEKQIETIGLATASHSNNDSFSSQTKINNTDFASNIADEIISLQNYQIQKSEKEFNEALMINDVFMQQPNIITSNDINPCKESKLIYLDQYKCTFKSNEYSNSDTGNKMKDICNHFNDLTFDVDQAMDLLQQLT